MSCDTILLVQYDGLIVKVITFYHRAVQMFIGANLSEPHLVRSVAGGAMLIGASLSEPHLVRCMAGGGVGMYVIVITWTRGRWLIYCARARSARGL